MINDIESVRARHDGHADIAQLQIGMTLRIATKPSYPSCANDHIEAAIGKLLGDQSRNLTVVIDAKNFLASFGHPFAPTRNKESTRWGESYPTAFDPYLRAGRYTVKSPRGLCD
jgi:hypothetical protein